MKKVSLVGTLRYLGIILIVMQGVLLALLAIFMLGDEYQKQWKEYGKNGKSVTIYLNGISEENTDEIEQYLFDEADANHLFIVRRDSSLMADGSFSGYMFGVYGDVESNEVSFSFYKKNILNDKMLSKLIQSEMEEATFGIDKGSVYSLGEIPYIRYGNHIVLKKLRTLIEKSGTIQGEYTIIGMDRNELQKVLADLSQIGQLPQEELLKAKNGEEIDAGFKKVIILVFILAQILLNIVFFIIITLKNLDKGGKLALLGWSKSSLCYELFGSFLWYAMISVPIFTIVGVVWSGWISTTVSYISHFFLYAALNLVLILVEVGIAMSIQMSISPLSAIRGRFPKKILYFLGILAYLGVSVGLIYCCLYIDSSVQVISENAKLSGNWKRVSNYQILKDISVGNDESSFSGASKELNQGIFDWYKEIHNEKGVYLINMAYYGNEILDSWKEKEIYTAVPQNEFWYFTVSPSYLEKIGIEVNNEILQAAESGMRIYLIPSGMSDEEKSKIKLWLEESSVSGINESDIKTNFNENRKIEFVDYNNYNDLFTWNTSTADENTCTMPVIYICTPENMTYFESESLRAVGLDGYIKFEDKDTSEKYLEKEFLKEFNLNDNNLVFADVQKYIDGLQKDLINTIAWFGLVFLILTIILIGILLTLATIFRIANQEKLNVQKFLGYGFMNMYLKPLIMICTVNVIEILIILFSGSKFGLIAMVLIFIIQIYIFFKYMTKNEIRSICMAFKEE